MTTQVPNSMLVTPGGGGGGVGGTTVAVAGTALTLNSGNTSTYNGNTLACSNGSAQTITINAGAALTGGFVAEQLGNGTVSLVAGGGVTLNAPNGLSTSGARSTIIVTQESTDVYSVFAGPTADKTQVIAVAGATPAIDVSKFNVFDVTLSVNATPAFSGAVSGQAFSATIFLRENGTGGFTWAHPSGTKWAGGAAPTIPTTASTLVAVITYTTLDGGASWVAFNGGTAFA